MARMMITPPRVGVPFFCCAPARPRSRTVSPICFLTRKRIRLLPKIIVTTSENTTASNTLEVMNWNNAPPGTFMPICFSHSNKVYNIYLPLFVEQFEKLRQHLFIVKRVFHPVYLLVFFVSFSRNEQ